MKALVNNNYRLIALIVAITLSVGTFYVKASTTINGRILDHNLQPLPYSTATIINPETYEIVNGDMTDENGEFNIQDVKPGVYILSLRMVGFMTNETRTLLVLENTYILHAGNISLSEANIVLNDLDVLPDYLTIQDYSI